MKSFLLKTLRFGIFALVGLIAFLAMLIVEEHYRGKHDWERYCREKAAKGERLDFKGLVPASVPEGENFAMTPLLRPLFQNPNQSETRDKLSQRLALGPTNLDAPRPIPWLGDRVQGKRVDLAAWKASLGGKDILAAVGQLDGVLREISAAVRRPYSRFPLQYEQGNACTFPYITALGQLRVLYTLRTCAELRAGQAEAAAADLETLVRLANATKDEPTLNSLSERNAGFQPGLQVVWEGLAEHRWSEPQLAGIQGLIAGQDLIAQLNLALRGERAGYNARMLQALANPEVLGLDSGTKFLLWGFVYQNLVAYNRACDALTLPSDAKSLRAYVERHRQEEDRLKRSTLPWGPSFPIPNLNTILASIGFPGFSGISKRTLYTQVCLDQAATACALERYWLANGQYPDSLGALVPDYLGEVLHDAASGNSFIYKRKAEGGFVLYSVGWNGVDDGGKLVFKPNSTRLDLDQGDWVW
jgi:hypothetical protein